MEKEIYRNYLMRLVVIQKDISRLSIECLKRNYENIESFMEEIKNLQKEQEMIIESLNRGELSR